MYPLLLFLVLGAVILYSYGKSALISKKLGTFLFNLTRMNYPIVTKGCFSSAIVFTKDADDIKILLTDKVNISKGTIYEASRMLLKQGLITSTGEKWHRRRKLLASAFHSNIMVKSIEIITEQHQRLISFLESQGNESVQNLVPLCSRVTLNIIVEATMGIDFDTVSDKAETYISGVNYFSEFVAYRVLRPYIKTWMTKWYSKGRKMLFYIDQMNEFTNRIINKRVKYHNQIKNDSSDNFVDLNNDEDKIGRTKRFAFLDLLLQAEKENLIDRRGINEEVDTFTAAGYETTTMGMVYTLMLLAENKEAQELARAEANRILSESGNKITAVEIQKMVYIHRCVLEALRLYPPAIHISRTLINDVQLTNETVTAGKDVHILIFQLHRNPKFWTDPSKFDPDRHLPEQVCKRHPYAFIPFSHGLRNCIGHKFAMAELKTLVARVLYNFYLEPIDYTRDLKFRQHALLIPINKPKIKFIKIEK